MLHNILVKIKDSVDMTIIVVILLISIFEFFVDRPALKREGLRKDAKITAIISIGWVVIALALAVVGITVR